MYAFTMMHLYGGKYSDVKHIHFAWRPHFEHSEKDLDHYAYGYGEIYENAVACFDAMPPNCKEIKSHFRKIIGNGYYIFKRDTPLTREWFGKAT